MFCAGAHGRASSVTGVVRLEIRHSVVEVVAGFVRLLVFDGSNVFLLPPAEIILGSLQ